MHRLIALDRWLLLLLNRRWSAPALDAVMPALTDPHRVGWIMFGAAPVALALWLKTDGWRAARVLVVGALAVGLSDVVAARLVKPWVARPRPPYAVAEVVVRAPYGGRLGFPSNHASNGAAAASVASIAYPAAAPAFWALAAFVAYSRVYCGVHYPFDVLGGLLLGALIGWPFGWLMLGRDAAKPSGPSRKKRR